jgi:hypothetical protein
VDADFVILPYHEVFYIESLRFSTDSALSSAAWVGQLLERIERGDISFDSHSALNQLQNIINQGGAISRFFWPSDKTYRARGELLRKAFTVSDSSPLRNRVLRNQVEHYDEYLDDYLKTVSAGVFTPHYFGPELPRDGVPRHYFKAFYFDVGIFELLGNRYEITPLVDEILRIHQLLLKCDSSGRFQPTLKGPTKPTEGSA